MVQTKMELEKTQTIEEIQEEIAARVAKEIEAEIDSSILTDILVKNGWIKIPYDYFDARKAVDMAKYCEQTFKKNQWMILSGNFIFRNRQDAEWFILKWS